VCIYSKDDLQCNARPDLMVQGIECCWLEVKAKPKQCLIACLYRPPGLPISFWQSFEGMVSQAFREPKDIIMCGDFNVDINSPGHHRTHLTDITSAFGLQQSVADHTRINLTGPPTTIDLMYSTLQCLSPTKTQPVSFSDHFAVLSKFSLRPTLAQPRPPSY